MVWHRESRLFKGVATTLMLGVFLIAPIVSRLPVLADEGSGLEVMVWNSWSAFLHWNAPPEVARIKILRDGRLLEDLGFAGGSTLFYRDYLLWPSTSYAYEVIAFDSQSQMVSDNTATVQTRGQSGAFPTLYDPASFWNQPIPAGAVADPDSAAMVAASLSPYGGSGNLTNSNEWGYPVAYANDFSSTYSVGCTVYDCATPVSFHIPRYATPTTASDHHLIVLEPRMNRELDMWMGAYDASADSWSAGSRYIAASNGWGAQCSLGQRCNGAVAAGFAAFGGVVRPEEIAQGHIDHALVFATPYTRAGDVACPATHTDGATNDPAALPEGARIQLDPSFDVDAQAWPAWEKVIGHALQMYGAYLGDTGGSLGFSAEPNLDRGYDAWSLAGVPATAPSLANLPWSGFRVLQLQPC